MPNYHREASRVWRLKRQGLNQQQIAAETGLSQPTVSRILSGPLPPGVPADQPADFAEVAAEFDEIFRQAKESGNIDSFRQVHRVARTAFENGYRVNYGTLPYIVALSAAQSAENIDSPAGRQRRKGWGLEIDSVYHFTKFYRLANWAKRPSVPVDEGFWENWLDLVEGADA